AKADPAPRSDVGGDEEADRVGAGEHLVFSLIRLEAGGDDAVAVVVVEEIGEHFVAHPETGVVAVDRARRRRVGETDRREADQAPVLGGFLLRLRHRVLLARGRATRKERTRTWNPRPTSLFVRRALAWYRRPGAMRASMRVLLVAA